MTRNQISIDTDTDTLSQLAAVITATGWSKRAAIERAIDHLHKQVCALAPVRTIGYIKLDAPGEVADPRCLDCGMSVGDQGWLSVGSDGKLTGPLCILCAEPKD